MTLMMNSAQVVETSVNVTNNSPSRDLFFYLLQFLLDNYVQGKRRKEVSWNPCKAPTLSGQTTITGRIPYSFSNSDVGSLTSPTKPMSEKMQETGPAVYRPYLRRIESLTYYRCHSKGNTFSSVNFEDLECWSGQALNPRPPARQSGTQPTERPTGRRSNTKHYG